MIAGSIKNFVISNAIRCQSMSVNVSRCQCLPFVIIHAAGTGVPKSWLEQKQIITHANTFGLYQVMLTFEDSE